MQGGQATHNRNLGGGNMNTHVAQFMEESLFDLRGAVFFKRVNAPLPPSPQKKPCYS